METGFYPVINSIPYFLSHFLLHPQMKWRGVNLSPTQDSMDIIVLYNLLPPYTLLQKLKSKQPQLSKKINLPNATTQVTDSQHTQHGAQACRSIQPTVSVICQAVPLLRCKGIRLVQAIFRFPHTSVVAKGCKVQGFKTYWNWRSSVAN